MLSMKFCIGYLNETWLKDKKEKNLDLLPILICGTHLQCGLKKKKSTETNTTEINMIATYTV